mgnify:CR=1 FL=1
MQQWIEGGVLLITGGTGSFGSTLLRKAFSLGFERVHVLSRDEKKQDDLRRELANLNVCFFLGDVRDRQTVARAMRGVDYVFHAAALKQVPSCEFFPIEAVNTNILGTENVLAEAELANVQSVVCLSTDKAVNPINAMGLSKGLMEKVCIARARFGSKPKIALTRYGNVMGSRGSVLPLFFSQAHQNLPLTITNPDMTRFMMTLDQAVGLVGYAFANMSGGEIFVQKAPGATVLTVAKAVNRLFGRPENSYKIVGERHGEKLHEVLIERNEMRCAINHDEQYVEVPCDDRDLNYGAFFEGVAAVQAETSMEEYNSRNTKQLDVQEVMDLILSVKDLADSINSKK